jgi:hypothetical protein
MDSADPVGSSPSISDAADSVRRWIASVILFAELRIRLLALESKEAGGSLTCIGGALGECRRTFCWLPCDGYRFCFVSVDADLPLGLGLERIGLRRGVAHYQYRCVYKISSQIIKSLYPTTYAEFKKDREWLSRQTKNSG